MKAIIFKRCGGPDMMSNFEQFRQFSKIYSAKVAATVVMRADAH